MKQNLETKVGLFLMAGIAITRAVALAPELPRLLTRIRPSLRFPTLPRVTYAVIFALLGILIVGVGFILLSIAQGRHIRRAAA